MFATVEGERKGSKPPVETSVYHMNCTEDAKFHAIKSLNEANFLKEIKDCIRTSC